MIEADLDRPLADPQAERPAWEADARTPSVLVPAVGLIRARAGSASVSRGHQERDCLPAPPQRDDAL